MHNMHFVMCPMVSAIALICLNICSRSLSAIVVGMDTVLLRYDTVLRLGFVGRNNAHDLFLSEGMID